MECNELGDANIADTVAVREAKGLFVLDVAGHALEASTGHGLVPGIDQGHLPWLCVTLVDLHRIILHVECDIGGVKEVVGEVFLDEVALVTATDDKVINAVCGIGFHDVPENGFAADLDHRFRF